MGTYHSIKLEYNYEFNYISAHGTPSPPILQGGEEDIFSYMIVYIFVREIENLLGAPFSWSLGLLPTIHKLLEVGNTYLDLL
jgi:hypothetical protein